MDDPADVADPTSFEHERSRLTGLAYRMLGSRADAEDVVQEAWIRWQAADRAAITTPRAWLTTVTSRLAIDRLRSQARRREDYVGPWLPEPVLTVGPAATTSHPPDPVEAVELAESMTLGFLVVLDRLGPVERAVFLLADVFGEPYERIGEIVGRSAEACRQIASRARRRVREERAARAPADEALLADLVGAVASGDVDRLLTLLAPDVVLTSDGGPNRRAARHPVTGPDRVARLMVNLASRVGDDATGAIESVNGAPALVLRSEGTSFVLTAETTTVADVPFDPRIASVAIIMNPDKIARLDEHADLI